MISDRVKKYIVQIISIALVAVVFFVLGKEVLAQWHLIKEYEFHLRWHLVLIATGVYSIAFFLFAVGWWLLMHNLRTPIGFVDSLIYFFITLPCKYVPGKIWTAVGRAKLCKKYSVSTSVCFVTTGLEGIMEVLAGIYISLFAVITSPYFSRDIKLATFAFVALGFLLLVPQIFYACINLVLRITKQPLIAKQDQVGFKKLIVVQIVYGAGMFLMGASQVIFLRAFTHFPMHYTLYLVGLGTFSYVASILAFFTPGGLGVREGVWYIALRGIVAEYVGLLFSLVSRLWTIIVESLLAFIALGFFFLLRHKNQQNGVNGHVSKELNNAELQNGN